MSYADTMIALQGVDKTYWHKKKPVKALQGIDLSVATGEIFGIIGASGAGKSSLLRLVNLLETPSSGQVCVDGSDLMTLSTAGLRDMRRHIGMIFQHFNLLNSRTVFDNIALPLRLSKLPNEKIQTRVAQLLELTGLTERRHAYPAQLSGGQKQRVAIARALAYEPKVLLCDEATSALDPQTTHTILELLAKINRELNITILLITHEMDVIKHICHRVAVLDQGHVVEENNVVDLFLAPKHPVTQRFLSSYMGLSLPAHLQKHLLSAPEKNTYPLLKVAFRGKSALKPILADLAKACETTVNILLANMTWIQDENVGVTILVLQNPAAEANALAFLRKEGITVEVLGYVPVIC